MNLASETVAPYLQPEEQLRSVVWGRTQPPHAQRRIVALTDRHVYLFRGDGPGGDRATELLSKTPIASMRLVAREAFLYVGDDVTIRVEDHLHRRAAEMAGVYASLTAGTPAAASSATREGRPVTPGWILLAGGAIFGAGWIVSLYRSVKLGSYEHLHTLIEELVLGVGLVLLGWSAIRNPYRGALRKRGWLGLTFGAIYAGVAGWVAATTHAGSSAPVSLLLLGSAAVVVGGVSAIVADRRAPLPAEDWKDKERESPFI